jgi:predicted ribosome quality control (RQC) complex YloA/Tae2 family protein
MFKNYYLFKKQIEQIRAKIIDSEVISVFTVNKNELVFELQKENAQFHLKINLTTHKPYILLESPRKIKSARLNFFETLFGQTLSDIKIAVYNKFLSIKFDSNYLRVFLYGLKPNIILFNEDNDAVESFKSLDFIVEEPNEIPLPLSSELLNNAISTTPNKKISELISAICPAFNKRMIKELFYRLGLNGEEKVKDIENKEELYTILSEFFNELESGKCFIYKKNDMVAFFTLYKSDVLKNNGFEWEEFSEINKGWSIFTYEIEKSKTYNQLYSKVYNAINKRKKTLEKALENISYAENIEERKRDADLKGNLILTNKHKIPRGDSYVELENIFLDTNEKVTIKLNPKKSAVENANHYFQKYKDIAEKKQVIKLKKNTYSKELAEISDIYTKVESSNIKDLLKIKEMLIDMNILQESSSKKDTADSLKFSFRRLILDNMWDIYIGKNNINNDLLTFSFANKWDIWMHAQGVPGSHVIIKVPGKDINVPSSIIEQAAQIAAANSKAKHSSTVPVIYTTARYVSRIRKALPGTVNVRNEKVIFVKPLTLNI